jgi:hypothetical protein
VNDIDTGTSAFQESAAMTELSQNLVPRSNRPGWL